MAKRWSEVIQNPRYQQLSDEEKEAKRTQYFEEVVKPRIKPEQYNDMWGKFINDAYQMEGVKQQPEIKPQMTLEEFNASADKEIAELEKTVKPKPDIIDRAKALFNPELDETMEDVKNRTRLAELKRMKELNNPETTLEKYNSSIAKGVMSGAGPKAVKAYIMDGDTRNDILYEPDSTGQRIVQGLGAIASDLPLYTAGSGITTGGMILKSAGSFALPKALHSMLDIRNEKGEVELSDVPEVMAEGGKGAIEGALFGAAGALGKTAAGFVPKYKGAVEQIVSTPLEVAIMSGSVKHQGGELNAETWGELIGTLGAMKLLHANPYALRSLKKQSEISGIPVEKLAENMKLDPKQAKILKDAEAWNRAAEESALRTEAQIKNEYKTRVQDEVIDKQIRANYKDGKPVEEIVKLEQIPKEYLPHVADMVEGKAVIKPEILQKLDNIINRKDPLASQKYEDILPGEMRDMIQRERNQILENHAKAQEELALKKDIQSLYEEQRGREFEQLVKREQDILLGDYRRYANQPKMREKMDKAIEHTLDTMTHEEKATVALDKSALKTFIDSKESGFADLKPNYQKAVLEELHAACMKQTNIYPKEIFEQAVKRAETKLKFEDKRYQEPVRELENTVQSLESHPEYQAHLKELQGKPEELVRQELETSLNKVKLTAEQELQANLVKFQRVMSMTPEYEGKGLNIKEYSENGQVFTPKEYGAHLKEYINFIKKPIEDIQKVFLKANYLDIKVNEKWMRENKERLVRTKIGKDVYEEVYRPIREVNYTVTHEMSVTEKQMNKLLDTLIDKDIDPKFDRIKGLRKKREQQIIDYFYTRQYAATDAMQKMGIEPVKWEQLSKQQQQVITVLDEQFAIWFDRLNAGREMVGLPPLNKVDNYFTLIRKVGILEKMGLNVNSITPKAFDDIVIEDVKTRAMSLAFGKHRERNSRELERDLRSALSKYQYAALRAIHYTPVIGKLREAANSYDFKLRNPNAQAYIDMVLDVVSGKKISEAKQITNDAARWVQRNLTRSVLAWNAHTIMVQPTSVLVAAQEVGTKFLAQGLKDYTNPSMRDFCMKESSVLNSRVYDVSIMESTKGISGTLGLGGNNPVVKGADYLINKGVKGTEKLTEWGMLPTKLTDFIAAQITWLSGYRYAKDELQLNHRGCKFYADDLVIKTQGSAAREDVSPMQHTPLGKLATTFQTFGINQFNYLATEVLGAGKTNKLVAENVTDAQLKHVQNQNQYLKKPTGKNKEGEETYNLYKPEALKNNRERLHDMAKFAVIMGVTSTIFELIDGAVKNTEAGNMVSWNSPFPTPLSAFYEGTAGQTWVDALYGQNPSTKEVNLIDGLVSSIAETATMFPISGSSLKYGGGNLFGAFGALAIDTANLISGAPGAKDWEIILAKWSGVPGSGQTYRILRELQKERIAENRKSKDPLSDIKRQMQQSNPFHKQSQRYKDPGLVQGLFQ